MSVTILEVAVALERNGIEQKDALSLAKHCIQGGDYLTPSWMLLDHAASDREKTAAGLEERAKDFRKSAEMIRKARKELFS